MKKKIRYSNEPLGKITVIPDFLPPITELNFKMKIHDKIRILRKEKNWTQEEMAEKLGMSDLGYGKVERGETDYLAGLENILSKLTKIANVLEISLEELLVDNEKYIYLISGDNNTGDNGCNVVIGSPTELAFEIQKLQLLIKNKELEILHAQQMLEQKEKEIALQQRENENLREIIGLLKSQSQTTV